MEISILLTPRSYRKFLPIIFAFKTNGSIITRFKTPNLLPSLELSTMRSETHLVIWWNL